MKSFEELTTLEKSVLLIWGNELNFNTKNHRQIEKINKRITANLPGIKQKDKKRINNTLITSGDVVQHPTGRSKTYGLSLEGLKCCNIIKRENDI
jgi:hypothetical protein